MGYNHTKAEFDRWAPTYDADAAGHTGWSAHRHVGAMIEQHANQASVTQIYDLGTGTGLMLPALREQFSQAVITAVDLSPNMLEICRTKNIADRLVEHDLARPDWPLPEGHADLVVCSGMLEFIKDAEEFSCNIQRLLRPGALFVATYQRPATFKGPFGGTPTYSRTDSDMKRIFCNAGLGIVQESCFPAYKQYGRSIDYGLIAARKFEA